ncbi:MAG: hypothetical protein ACOCZQ_02025, partial [Nanoarchaeota archaeon]
LFLTKAENSRIKKETGCRSVYSNCMLFITPYKHVEFALRLNKTLMFVKNRHMFNVYRFISRLGSYFQRLLLQRFSETTKTHKGKLVEGIDLDYIPRFSFCSQIDINQPITEDFLRKMYCEGFDSIFHHKSVNKFNSYEITNYFHMIGYDKKNSASYKIKHYAMSDWERQTFEEEMEDGCRSEIKLKLKRNIHETLSYAFALGCIRQESFYDLVTQPNKKFSKKQMEFWSGNWINGHIEFNRNKCVILFDADNTIQVREIELSEKVLTHALLEGSWAKNAPATPPPTENQEVYKVKWKIECDEVVSRNQQEDIYLEVIRDF